MSYLSQLGHRFNDLPHSWPLMLVVACGCLLGALAVYQVASWLILRLIRDGGIADLLVRRARRPLRLSWLFLVLQIVWGLAPSSLVGIKFVRHISLLFLIAAIVWFLVRFISIVGEALIRLKVTGSQDPGQVDTDLGVRGLLTRSRVLTRTLNFLIVLVGGALMLMTFPDVKQIGASLLASAGIVGVVVGFAARPVLSNLLAGLQIAITEPIRLNDVLVVDGQWGRVEEITGTYVTFCIWNQRRMVIPLQWFIEHPFQNWTRRSAEILGTVFLWVDPVTPVDALRDELSRICQKDDDWDQRVAIIQVTDVNENAMQVRALVSSKNSASNWNLRCRVREGLISFLQDRYPHCLPRHRQNLQWSEREASPLHDDNPADR